MWDALLGEGRHFWIFADSDFHNTEEEFWPGQYNQDHTWVPEFTPAGHRRRPARGQVVLGHGRLINELDFQAASGGPVAEMGGTLAAGSGSDVTVTIRFKSPATNYHGDVPVVDHVDLIAGNVTGLIDPSSPEFRTNKTNPSTHVVQRFTAADWTVDGEGFNVITTTVDRRLERHVLPPARHESRRRRQEPDRRGRRTAHRHEDGQEHGSQGMGRPLVLLEPDLHRRVVSG